MPTGAIIGAASLGSALIGSNAAKSAASMQSKAAAAAAAGMQPYSIPGRGAAATLAEMYGIDPNTGERTGQPMSAAALAAFERSPDYQFARQEGLRGVEFSNAARGMLRSGNNLRGLTEYASGLATQNFNNYRNSLTELARIGSGAAGASGQATMAQGAANASGTIGAANAWMGGLGAIGNYAMLQSIMGQQRQTGLLSAYGPQPGVQQGGTGSLAAGAAPPAVGNHLLPGIPYY